MDVDDNYCPFIHDLTNVLLVSYVHYLSLKWNKFIQLIKTIKVVHT